MTNHLSVPKEVRKRTPTTDTYSLSQKQDEFYFTLPYDKIDLCLYGKNNGISIEIVAEYRVEMVCEDAFVERVITSLRQSHPYEEPAFDIIKVEDFS